MRNKSSLTALTFSFALPLALQNVLAFAVNMLSTVLLGRMGDIPLSASAQANQLFFIVTLAVGGIAGGANVLTAQYWGVRDVDAIHRVLAYAYRTALAFALLVTALAVAAPGAVMRLLSDDPQVVEQGIIYLRVAGWSYLFYTVTAITTGVLQSVHTVGISVASSLLAMGVNAFLSWALIFGVPGVPAMGILGAAWATLIARALECAVVVAYVYGWEDKLRIRVKKLLGLDKSLARPYLATSAPVIANELFWALGDAALAVLLGRLGTEVVAANSIAAVANQLASVLSRGVTAAACVIVANAVGAGEYEKLAGYKRYFQRLAVAMGVGAGVVILLARPVLLRLYNVEPITLEYAGQLMLFEAGLQVFRFFQIMNMMGLLRGGGDVRFAMLNDLVFLWGFAVPAGFFAGLALHWPVLAVYAAIRLDQVVKCVTSEWRLKSGRWVRNMLKNGGVP